VVPNHGRSEGPPYRSRVYPARSSFASGVHRFPAGRGTYRDRSPVPPRGMNIGNGSPVDPVRVLIDDHVADAVTPSQNHPELEAVDGLQPKPEQVQQLLWIAERTLRSPLLDPRGVVVLRALVLPVVLPVVLPRPAVRAHELSVHPRHLIIATDSRLFRLFAQLCHRHVTRRQQPVTPGWLLTGDRVGVRSPPSLALRLTSGRFAGAGDQEPSPSPAAPAPQPDLWEVCSCWEPGTLPDSRRSRSRLTPGGRDGRSQGTCLPAPRSDGEVVRARTHRLNGPEARNRTRPQTARGEVSSCSCLESGPGGRG
jgi:hypothetical protein